MLNRTHERGKRFQATRGRLARCLAAATLLAGCGSETVPSVQSGFSAPGQPLPTLTEADRGRFLLGKALFERLATPEEGLGPLFNASRCSDCHAEPSVGGTSLLLVTKASRFEDDVCSELIEEGGGNIQQRTTSALGALGVLAEPMPPSATEQAVFLAPPLFGLGLLEAIPEADILAMEDPDDLDGDGISGRAHWRPDGALGRFGWKGDSPSIAHFVDTAIRFEIGLTTPQFPTEEGVNGAPLPPDVDPAPEPEIDANGVALLADFVRYLGAPAPLSGPAPSTTDGARAFTEIGCAGCHTPDLGTEPVGSSGHRFAIRPFTDLLLHDMGPALSGTCAGTASPTEYRTPPLWGLRYRDLYLHDGRATSLADAVLRHGGEGEGARERFQALSDQERAALLSFLNTL